MTSIEQYINYLTEKKGVILNYFKEKNTDLCKLCITHSDVWVVSYKIGYRKDWCPALVKSNQNLEMALKELCEYVKWWINYETPNSL